MNQKRFQKIRSDWRNFPSSLVWANSTAFNWVLREVVVNLIRKQICLHSYLAEANVGKSSPFLAILSPVSLKIHLEENNHKKKHHLLLLWKPQNPFGNETNAASYGMVTLLWLSLSLASPRWSLLQYSGGGKLVLLPRAPCSHDLIQLTGVDNFHRIPVPNYFVIVTLRSSFPTPPPLYAMWLTQHFYHFKHPRKDFLSDMVWCGFQRKVNCFYGSPFRVICYCVSLENVFTIIISVKLARSVVVLFKLEITLHCFVIQLNQEYLYSFLLENSCSSI